MQAENNGGRFLREDGTFLIAANEQDRDFFADTAAAADFLVRDLGNLWVGAKASLRTIVMER